MIETENLGFSYNKSRRILEEVSFQCEKGHCLALLGNNGAGKSTLLRCLNRILAVNDGKVVVCGRDLYSLKRKEIARTMAYVEQRNEGYSASVFDAVLLGRKPYISMEPKKEDLEIVQHAISRLGLEGFELRMTDELSGGELQKVMIARALAQQPKVLLLDEPTNNLDLKNQHELMRLMRRIAREDQILVILVIHDLNLALDYCDRFLFMKDGKIYSYGDASVVTEETISFVFDVKAKIETVAKRKIVMIEEDFV